ncbi:uncharacterized protein PWA37_001918 [Arxiozyma heterogenica]|uniref:uncharacterized protein n=2 Tax=Arxiozyma heterogenica TaxID=278026 RepID=UPI002F22C82F
MSSNNLNMNEFLDAIDASTATEHHTTAPTTTPAPTTNLTADPTSAPAPVPSDSKYYSTAPMRFSGRYDLFKLPDFLVTVEAQLYARNLQTDVDRIAFFGRNLTGPAAQWYVQWIRNHDQHSYEQFLVDFKNKFIGMIDPHAILNAFQRLKEATVGIDAYNQKFSQLLALMPSNIWTPKGELLFYYRGLTPDTARMVALARPTTVDAAMEAASETVSITNRSFPTFTTYDMDGDIHMTAALNPVPMDSTTDHHPQVAAVYRSHGRGGRKGNHKSSQANKQPIKRPSRQYCIDHGLCFYCYKPLHRYSDCPNRKASSPK